MSSRCKKWLHNIASYAAGILVSISLTVKESFSNLFIATLLCLTHLLNIPANSHTYMCVLYFSLTARCGTSAAPEETPDTAGICILSCRLQTGCPQFLQGRFTEALSENVLSAPSGIVNAMCHVQEGKLWYPSLPGKGTLGPAAWQLCFSQHPSSPLRSSMAEQHTPAEEMMSPKSGWLSHILALVIMVRGHGDQGGLQDFSCTSNITFPSYSFPSA